MADKLGEFEQILLLALLHLGDGGHGAALQTLLRQRAGREVSLGTVYKTLFRLEAKGLVVCRLGESTPERGGRRKKLYRITPAGSQALQGTLNALRRMSQGLDAAWELP